MDVRLDSFSPVPSSVVTLSEWNVSKHLVAASVAAMATRAGGAFISQREATLRHRNHEYDEAVDGPEFGASPHFRSSSKPPKVVGFRLTESSVPAKLPWFDHGPIQITDGSSAPMPHVPQYRPARPPKQPLPKLQPLPPLFTQPFTPLPVQRKYQAYGIETVDPVQSPWWQYRPNLPMQAGERPLPRVAPHTAFPGARATPRVQDARLQLVSQRSTREFAEEMQIIRGKLNSARNRSPNVFTGAGALLQGRS